MSDFVGWIIHSFPFSWFHLCYSKTCMCTGSCLDYLDLFKLDWFRPLFESAWLVGDPESQGLARCFPRRCHLPHTQHGAEAKRKCCGTLLILLSLQQKDVCSGKILVLWLNDCSTCMSFAEMRCRRTYILPTLPNFSPVEMFSVHVCSKA